MKKQKTFRSLALLAFVWLGISWCCSTASAQFLPCVDPGLINPGVPCPAIVDPVCGCDGATYPNACEAMNYNGITAWAGGACGTQACLVTYNYNLVGGTTYNFVANLMPPVPAGSIVMWDFGDGNSANVLNPQNTYANPGTYVACLRVMFPATTVGVPGCVSLYCQVIQVLCIDPAQINTSIACPTTFNPVCGCDSVTYQNACVALNYHGVTSWTPGPCPTNCNAQFNWVRNNSAPLEYTFTHSGTLPASTNFHWSFGDGSTGIGSPVTHTYPGPGTYVACLTVSYPNSTGTIVTCTWCDTITILCVDPTLIDPTIQCPPVNNPVCGCDSVTYSNSCIALYGHGVTTWTSGPCPVNCSVTFTYAGSNTNPATYHFVPSPLITANTVYHWTFGDGGTSNSPTPTHTYSAPGTYTVCVTATYHSSTGQTCTATWCDTLVVPCINPNLINTTVICPAIYDPVCGCDSVTYQNACIALNYHGVQFFTPGTCQPAICHAMFTWTRDIYNPLLYTFNETVSSNLPLLSLQWSFGDGTTGSGSNPTHQYPGLGTYVVCLTATFGTATGSLVCVATYCDTIEIVCKDSSLIQPGIACPAIYAPVCGCDSVTYNNACEAVIIGGVSVWTPGPCPQPCSAVFTWVRDNQNPLLYHFTGPVAPTPPVAYHWTFGDGGTSNQQNPSHQYGGPGTYTVCLTVTYPNSTGTLVTCTWCDTVTILCVDPTLINPAIPCPTIYAPVCGCDSVTYQNACVAMNYHGVTTWTNGPCPQPCSAVFTWVRDNQNPLLYHFTGPFPVPSTASFNWTFGDGGTSNLPNPSHQYGGPGTYTVCLTVTYPNSTGTLVTCTWCDTITILCVDPTLINPAIPCPTIYAPVCGCDSVTYQNACVAMNYHGVTTWTPGPCPQPCSAVFTWVRDNQNPLLYHFTGPVPPTTPVAYHWNFGDGNTSNQLNPSHQYAGPGTYIVCLTISYPNSTGALITCTWCDTITILCVDPTLINPTVPCLTIYDPVCGCDSVTYSNACVAMNYHGVTTWTQGPCPTNCQVFFTFSYGIFGPDIFFFDNSAGNPVAWHWDFGDGNTSNLQNPVHSYSTTGTYTVCLTITLANGDTCTYCETHQFTGCVTPPISPQPPHNCNWNYNPVCGCNNVTYINPCFANYAGVNYWTPGVCPGQYCPSFPRNPNVGWIHRIGTYVIGNNGGYGYHNLCSSVALVAGNTYSLQLVGAISGPVSATAHWRIWADFNHDFDFDDPGELLWQGTGGLIITATFTIPANACSGCTRFRFQLSDNFRPACGAFRYGDVEDLDLRIISTVSCRTGEFEDNFITPTENFADMVENAIENLNPEFQLFPNPANDKVTLAFGNLAEEGEALEIGFYSIDGRLVLGEQTNGSDKTLTISTRDLPAGVYHVTVVGTKGKTAKKLVITR